MTRSLDPTINPTQIRSATEPVRKWLQSLSSAHKKSIGEDIKTVQFGWPLGMPLVEKIKPFL